MTNPQTIERVRELRQRGRTPKAHDDAPRIIRTLRRSVGDDNFHHLCQIA